MNQFEIRRLLTESGNSVPVLDRLAAIKDDEYKFVQFPHEPVDRMVSDFWQYNSPQDYMHCRGFHDDTLKYFDIGYSVKRDMIIIPMHDPIGMLVGFVGRAVGNAEQRFKNSNSLPKSKTAWNFHRAKVTGDTVIIVESSFDAMRVHQAGYPNVIALLGGSLSEHHIRQIERTFAKIVIMTDFDKPRVNDNCKYCEGKCVGHRDGRDFGRKIANKLSHKRILWAAYNDECVYPNDAKDASDMTDEEIVQCLRNAISNFEYLLWDIELQHQ